MEFLTKDYIRDHISNSKVIYTRGENIFHMGNYSIDSLDFINNSFTYTVDGNYGNYDIAISFDKGLKAECTCPYPYGGCKHIVAVCLDLSTRIPRNKTGDNDISEAVNESDFLTYEEIRQQVIDDRKRSAKNKEFSILRGETCRGEHYVITKHKKRYIVTIHDPAKETGHCNCPDYTHNRLSLCKHLLFVFENLKKDKAFFEQGTKERMPFIHIYWDSYNQKPCYFYNSKIPQNLESEFHTYFSENGLYKKNDITELYRFLISIHDNKNVKVDEFVVDKVDTYLFLKEMFAIKKTYQPDYSGIKATLYPYQKEGIAFALFKTRAIIADEMGLGKTLQAITLGVLKKELFGFRKVLIICPASLKEQWKREIERFTEEKAVVVSGPRKKRQHMYEHDPAYFFITNYEAVLRDIMVIHRCKPDLVILDEAQRIKNFETKTHQAILTIPRKQSLVITGTPLENKLEDLYSIVQFSDPELFSPLWIFAANHFKLLKNKKTKVAGYKNLDIVHKKLKNIVIRRTKEEVLDCLPEQITNNYYIDLTVKQRRIHQGYIMSLLPILNKKIITPFDLRRIQQLLLCMRMVCDSTYLIDRKTNESPKLEELKRLLTEIVIENKRKTIIFSEWTTMTYLIGKVLSEMEIPFVEFTGKVPTDKRQNLINEFTDNEECMVFLSSDAGGVGLNLQAGDCVINFELPWNPAKMKQRIGRVNRIGQKSRCINVINFIAKQSIEESVAAGIVLKEELFNAVLDGKGDEVDFSREKKTEYINQIRKMINEELIVPASRESDREDIPDSTPHFLNPKVLGEDKEINYTEEEIPEEDDIPEGVTETEETTAETFDPEKMEEVLENGIKFLSGLTAMTTGKPLIMDEGSKSVHVDRTTGEVTLKFKLPGFSTAK